MTSSEEQALIGLLLSFVLMYLRMWYIKCGVRQDLERLQAHFDRNCKVSADLHRQLDKAQAIIESLGNQIDDVEERMSRQLKATGEQVALLNEQLRNQDSLHANNSDLKDDIAFAIHVLTNGRDTPLSQESR